jgi:hypothetical protein
VTFPPRLLRTLLLRGTFIWIFGRIMAVATLAMAQSSVGRESPLYVETATVPPYWTLALAALVSLADLHRRKETMLLANLGIRLHEAILVTVAPAVLLEVILSLAIR